jgi:hypothetical protein
MPSLAFPVYRKAVKQTNRLMYRNDNYTSQVPSLAGHVSAAHLAKESYGKYLSHADLTTYTDANAEQLAIRWLLRLNSLNPKTKFAFFYSPISKGRNRRLS